MKIESNASDDHNSAQKLANPHLVEINDCLHIALTYYNIRSTYHLPTCQHSGGKRIESRGFRSRIHLR